MEIFVIQPEYYQSNNLNVDKDLGEYMVPEAINTLEKCIEVHKLKNADYTGNNSDPLFNFHMSQVIMNYFTNENDKIFVALISTKLARIAALRNSGNKPNNESLFDSFDDLINYTALWKADIQRG